MKIKMKKREFLMMKIRLFIAKMLEQVPLERNSNEMIL